MPLFDEFRGTSQRHTGLSTACEVGHFEPDFREGIIGRPSNNFNSSCFARAVDSAALVDVVKVVISFTSEGDCLLVDCRVSHIYDTIVLN